MYRMGGKKKRERDTNAFITISYFRTVKPHEGRTVQSEEITYVHTLRTLEVQNTEQSGALRACLEVLAGERSYSYTLDRRPVLLYRGWSSSSTERAASGGTHMERTVTAVYGPCLSLSTVKMNSQAQCQEVKS
ncbi:hypothetical protein MG293_017184 [Ovis ammon polii]|uniref:Uncharacterized protein n=1 Tax=Ovis ammon polii TaxID=230172 RepID=A0AAD4TT12_OVIAM|nr:hypothetical protein MG293_017184 [Ovis ammon polii]